MLWRKMYYDFMLKLFYVANIHTKTWMFFIKILKRYLKYTMLITEHFESWKQKYRRTLILKYIHITKLILIFLKWGIFYV